MQNLPFQEFLAQLARQGFTIGVEHHLRLQAVLNALPPDCAPSDVKFYLCPMFAANAKQQQQFYHAFDAYFAAFEPERVREEEQQAGERRKAAPPLPEPKRWQYVLLGALATLLIFVISTQWQYDMWIWPSLKRTPTMQAEATPTPAPEMSPTPETTVTPGAAPTAVPTPQAAPTAVNWRYRALLSYIDYRLQIRLLLVLTPLLVLGLMEAWRWQQRKLVLERRRGKRPPRVWPIQVDAPPLPFLQHDPLRSAARLLRRRVTGNRREIDVNASLSATLAAGLFPTLRYRHVTRPPEYLILIELPAWRDHAAQFADSIAEALQHDAVFVERYFYERDPRVCFREPDGEREFFADLIDRYRDHRLILIGTGDSLLDPISGAFEGHAALFLEWRDRAMLTPLPVEEWGLREITLSREFPFLPATLDGFAALAEFWDNPTSPPNPLSKGEGETSPLPVGEGPGVGFLRDDLGEPVFQWLCACAVYPELRWNVTIWLATLPCMPKNLLTEEHLLRLIRLPYFREGVMPDELRWELIGALTPETERAIRAELVRLLEQNPPPEESIAAEGFQLTLAAQRLWALGKNRGERNTLKKTIRQSGDLRLLHDYTLVRFLEGASASPLRFVLPRRLRKLFFRHGLPLFGLKSGVRLALALLFAVGAFVVERNYSFVLHDPVANVEYGKQGERFTLRETTTDMAFVYVPGGCFMMGQTGTDKTQIIAEIGKEEYEKYYLDELPRHEVCVEGFWMGQYEVTNAQYRQFKADHDSQDYEGNSLNGDDQPAVYVSWNDAQAFVEWLNATVGAGSPRPLQDAANQSAASDGAITKGAETAPLQFRLPSEAEWEYAARAGTTTVRYWGDDPNHDQACRYANVHDQTSKKAFTNFTWQEHNCDDGYAVTAPVGSFQPNAFGLYDMLGNVYEWAADTYHENYQDAPNKGDIWEDLDDNKAKVLRGGSWYDLPGYLRGALRVRFNPADDYYSLGFRAVVVSR